MTRILQSVWLRVGFFLLLPATSISMVAAKSDKNQSFVPKFSVPSDGKMPIKPTAKPADKKAGGAGGVTKAPPAAAATPPPPPPDKPLRLHLGNPIIDQSTTPPVKIPQPASSAALAVPAQIKKPARNRDVVAPMANFKPPPDPEVILQPHGMLPMKARGSVATRAKPASPEDRSLSKIVDGVVDRFLAKNPNNSRKSTATTPKRNGKRKALDTVPKLVDNPELERQKISDETRGQVVSSIMEIAMGLGMPDQSQGSEVVSSGMRGLNQLVGDANAKVAYDALKSWLDKHKVLESVFKTPLWDSDEREKKLSEVLQSARQKDALLAGWKEPESTPGHEDTNDIQSERAQSRMKLITQEAGLAIDNYRFALVTHNPPLLAFSKALVSELSSNAVATKVFAPPPPPPDPLQMDDDAKPAKQVKDDDDA